LPSSSSTVRTAWAGPALTTATRDAAPTSSKSAETPATSPMPPLVKRRRKRCMTTLPCRGAAASSDRAVDWGETLSAPRTQTHGSNRRGGAPAGEPQSLLELCPGARQRETGPGVRPTPSLSRTGAGAYGPCPDNAPIWAHLGEAEGVMERVQGVGLSRGDCAAVRVIQLAAMQELARYWNWARHRA
jgi:hypothetical protein